MFAVTQPPCDQSNKRGDAAEQFVSIGDLRRNISACEIGFLSAFLLYGSALLRIRRNHHPPLTGGHPLPLILCFAICFRLFMWVSPPTLSDDIYDSHYHEGQFKNCMDGKNSELKMTLTSTELQKAKAGSYSGFFRAGAQGGSSGTAVSTSDFKVSISVASPAPNAAPRPRSPDGRR